MGSFGLKMLQVGVRCNEPLRLNDFKNRYQIRSQPLFDCSNQPLRNKSIVFVKLQINPSGNETTMSTSFDMRKSFTWCAGMCWRIPHAGSATGRIPNMPRRTCCGGIPKRSRRKCPGMCEQEGRGRSKQRPYRRMTRCFAHAQGTGP